MRSGAVGKSGFLRLGFERRGERTILADLESRAPYLAQRALHCDEALPDLAWLFVITTSGCVLQGDRLALDVALGPRRAGARHDAVGDQDPHDGRQLRGADADDHARRRRLSRVPARSADPAPAARASPATRGSRSRRPRRCSTRRSCSRDASTITRTSASAPRCCRWRPTAARPDGQPLFSEKLVIEPARRPMRQTGVMDGFDVFGNVILLHARRTTPIASTRASTPTSIWRTAWRSARAGCPTTPA